jgi:hypothetical protein
MMIKKSALGTPLRQSLLFFKLSNEMAMYRKDQISVIVFFNLETVIEMLRKCNILIQNDLKNFQTYSRVGGNFSNHSGSIDCVCGAFQSPFLGSI